MQYMAEMRPHLDDVGTALYEVGVLLTQAGHDPYLFLDEDWQSDVALHLAAMELNLVSLEVLTAPSVLEGAHHLMLMAVDEYRMFSDAVTAGIDNLDDAKLLRAQDYVEEATQTMVLSDAAWQVACE